MQRGVIRETHGSNIFRAIIRNTQNPGPQISLGDYVSIEANEDKRRKKKMQFPITVKL